jgi:hypothetical protein
MQELKEKEERKLENCHYCDREQVTLFLYDLNNSIDTEDRSKIPVCGIHFNKLCNMSYTTAGNSRCDYLSSGQQEYVSVRKLEKLLGITTHHK